MCSSDLFPSHDNSGGQGQGVSNPGTTAVQAGLQARMMGVQLQNIQSQTALNSAQAAKAMSESEKIKGVDTEEKKVTIENIIAQTENEKERKALIKQNTRVEIAQEELLNTTSDLNMAKRLMVRAQFEFVLGYVHRIGNFLFGNWGEILKWVKIQNPVNHSIYRALLCFDVVVCGEGGIRTLFVKG